MKVQNNSNNCSKQMAMTAMERNWLMLENMKKSAAIKGGQLPKGSSTKGKKQPKPRQTTGGKASHKAILKTAAHKSTLATGRVKKWHHYRPGTVALHEIHRYQKTTELFIAMSPFSHLV